MQTRSHRADRTTDRRRGVGVTEFVKIAKHDGLAIAHRQREHRAPQRVQMTPVVEIACRIGFDGKLRRTCLRLIVKRERGPDRTGAAGVVARDAQQPEPCGRLAGTVPARAVDDSDEGLVNDVLGRGVRAAHVRGKTANVGVMSAVKLGECLTIAFGDPSDDQIVR